MTQLSDALNRLCKWRSVFAGWQLGTRLETDPEAQAVRDHRDLSMLLRVEVSALTALLLDKGVFTHEELEGQLIDEAEMLNKMYEQRFPGAMATNAGMTFDQRFVETARGWRL